MKEFTIMYDKYRKDKVACTRIINSISRLMGVVYEKPIDRDEKRVNIIDCDKEIYDEYVSTLCHSLDILVNDIKKASIYEEFASIDFVRQTVVSWHQFVLRFAKCGDGMVKDDLSTRNLISFLVKDQIKRVICEMKSYAHSALGKVTVRKQVWLEKGRNELAVSREKSQE